MWGPCEGGGTHRSWPGGREVGEGLTWRGKGRGGFGSGAVGGRGTGAGTEQISQRVVFLSRTKRRKMAFFEGCPVKWEGVDQGP